MQTLLINGTWRTPRERLALDVVDPSTGKTFAEIGRGRADDIDDAVTAARASLSDSWGQFTALERSRVLLRAASLVSGQADELAKLEARETGKPLRVARAEIDVVARYFEFYGGAADKVGGHVIPYLAGHNAVATREPLGVTAHIIPWNYPAVMFGRSIAPALAVGNATVLKPAEDACLTTLKLAQILLDAGLPAGALNVVTGTGDEAGAALAAHPGIDFISFTGSPRVGTLVQQAAAINHVRCVLELGGKSPQIVFDDADLDAALPVIVNAIVQNAGQTCSAGSRVLIARDSYASFTARLAEAFSALQVGAPEHDAACGPLINRTQLERVTRFVDRASRDGVAILARGRIKDGTSPDGYFFAPTLFGNVPRDHELARDEVFGPVLAALPFDSEEHAIALANDTPYGLVTGVWTRDGDRQARMARRVRSGQVFINCYGAGAGVELPFGGFGRSGYGREKGLAALEEMSAVKTVVHRYG
ncbi:aldehyde dehydrogenase family protein [Paraburkholderia sp. BCC1886]|uniref:aldehyde dehydrogenase family protein n=1 Tax=Paraburkholderia sp. BCC1886 TaxID=2562670 RepID=UPI0011824724|nr:aldehyde dehydrogenase family protein [Paraburkholderia sp. BCC1886]